jgi:hypothetical protein
LFKSVVSELQDWVGGRSSGRKLLQRTNAHCAFWLSKGSKNQDFGCKKAGTGYMLHPQKIYNNDLPGAST